MHLLWFFLIPVEIFVFTVGARALLEFIGRRGETWWAVGLWIAIFCPAFIATVLGIMATGALGVGAISL